MVKRDFELHSINQDSSLYSENNKHELPSNAWLVVCVSCTRTLLVKRYLFNEYELNPDVTSEAVFDHMVGKSLLLWN